MNLKIKDQVSELEDQGSGKQTWRSKSGEQSWRSKRQSLVQACDVWRHQERIDGDVRLETGTFNGCVMTQIVHKYDDDLLQCCPGFDRS